jgi:hypothetical protein
VVTMILAEITPVLDPKCPKAHPTLVLNLGTGAIVTDFLSTRTAVPAKMYVREH